MAEQVRIDLTANDDASKVIDAVADDVEALEKLEPEIPITATDQASDTLAQVEAEIKKLSGVDAEIVLRAKIDNAKADLRALQDQLEQVARPVDLDVDSSNARRGIDDVGRSADSSKSALANMVGNTTQDLGAMGGAAGSAGVAIGQMGEYIADAAFSGEKLSTVITNFAKVAGPIAAMVAVFDALQSVQGRLADSSERATDNQARWTDAILAGGDAAANYAEALAETEQVTLDLTRTQSKAENVVGELASKWYLSGGALDFVAKKIGATGAETESMNALMAEAGVTVEQLTRAATGGADEQAKLAAAIDATGLAADDKNKLLELLAQTTVDYTTATSNAEIVEKIFGTAVAKTTTEVEAGNRQQSEYLRLLRDRHNATAAEVDQYNQLKSATERYYSSLGRLNTEAERVDRARILHRESDAVNVLADDYAKLHDEIGEESSWLRLQEGLERSREEFALGTLSMRDARAAILEQKEAALDYIEVLGDVPAEVSTEILALIDQHRFAEAQQMLGDLTRARTVEISVNLRTHLDELELQRQIRRAYANAGLPAFGPTSMPTTVVNVAMPRGSRGVDVVRQLGGEARRSGRRYGVPVVHYSRAPR